MSVSSGSYNCNHLLRRPGQELDDDASTLPLPLPSLSRRCSPLACPPPIGPLPEPDYHTQLLLGEMFSQQATMRNYCADSIQAFMMALDDQRRVQQERIQEEEASLALARMLQRQEIHEQQAVTRQSLVSSDLSLDLGSISEDSSSLESRQHPDSFTTNEAKLSAKELRGFEQEIMPYPSSPGNSAGKDQKMAAAYAYVPLNDEKQAAFCGAKDASILKGGAPPNASSPVRADCCDGRKKKKRRDRQCLICHRSTAECRLRMRKLSCGHQFCRSCIDRWLDEKDSCPYCRQKVSEQTRQKIRRQNSVGACSA